MCHSAAVVGALIFVFGMVVGSFLNVCILRIPADLSIVSPRSRCPKCEKPIAAYDNIPVLSWALLGGKCRYCKARISAMYPAVELLTGALFLACYVSFDLSLEAAKWAVLSAVLIVLTITDIRERLLPDEVNLTGAIFGLAFSLFVPIPEDAALWLANRWFAFPPPAPALSVANALLAAALAGGVLWAVRLVAGKVWGREALGLGDVKMMAMLGFFFGPLRTLWTFIHGTLIGTFVIGIPTYLFLLVAPSPRRTAWRAHRAGLGSAFPLWVVIVRRSVNRLAVPLGTFLGIGALLEVFFGPFLLEKYGVALSWITSFLRGVQ